MIEAVARTPIMGFRDDVSLRVRPDDDGARIDVRSASRYVRHDFGGNASRIRCLLEDIEDRAAPTTARRPNARRSGSSSSSSKQKRSGKDAKPAPACR